MKWSDATPNADRGLPSGPFITISGMRLGSTDHGRGRLGVCTNADCSVHSRHPARPAGAICSICEGMLFLAVVAVSGGGAREPLVAIEVSCERSQPCSKNESFLAHSVEFGRFTIPFLRHDSVVP